MSGKPVVLRQAAQDDVDRVVEYYLGEAADEAALRFVAALEKALASMSRHPRTGSPHFAHELDLVGLRCWRLRHFPYLVFYVVHEDQVDVWRVLHSRRDIPAALEGLADP